MKKFIQMFLLAYTILMGFIFSYVLLWSHFTMPVEWWSQAIVFVMAGLSTIGLIRWIAKG